APDERARVFEFLTVAGRGQGLNADIYADLGFGLLERLNLSFDEDTDKIALTCISADGKADEFRVVGKLSAPDDVERLRLLGESYQAIFKCEGVRGVTGRLAAAPGFESWILRPLLEEIREGRIKVTQRLLEHDGTDFGKKGPLGFLFPLSEFCRGGMIADGFLILLPGDSSIFQGLIVNIASATEGLCKLRCLLVSREESVFEGLLYYHEIFYSG